jgi:hypothetical protein
MEITRRLLQLKENTAEAAREAERAEGVLEAMRKSMKKKFGVSTVKQAKALIEKLNAELREHEQALLHEVTTIEREVESCSP